MNSLVILGEGEGEKTAAPQLVKYLLGRQNAFSTTRLIEPGMRVGELPRLLKNDYAEWKRFLKVATTTYSARGCLLIVDGDCDNAKIGRDFCARDEAIRLAEAAKEVRAGEAFSVAIVFACMEFESWLLAGGPSLKGRRFSDGRVILKPALRDEFPLNPEVTPRDAKGWFKRNLISGYSPTRDQTELVRAVDWDMVRGSGMRSFQRLENAVKQLVTAMDSGVHVCSPSGPEM